MLANLLGAELKGQQLLFSAPEIALRQTPFKSINPQTDREVLIHWWMNVYVPDGTGAEETPCEVYSSWSSAVYPAFRYVRPSGFCPETKQSTIKLSAYKHESVEAHLADLELWLPHIKPSTKNVTCRDEPLKGPAKFVDIFERTLSEHGSYSLFIYAEDDLELQKLAWSNINIVHRSKSLVEMVEYVRDRHWYEKGESPTCAPKRRKKS